MNFQKLNMFRTNVESGHELDHLEWDSLERDTLESEQSEWDPPSDGTNNMEHGSLVGLLLDVSGSMKKNAVGSVQEDGEWIRSLFQVIDDIIKHDCQTNNQIFTIGFGCKSSDGTFDILKSIENARKQREKMDNNTSKANIHIVEEIFDVLKNCGAKYIRKWTTAEIAQQFLTQGEAMFALKELHKDKALATRVVHECLPEACRQIVRDDHVFKVINFVFGGVTTSVVSTFRQAKPSEVQSAIESGIAYIRTNANIGLLSFNMFNAVKSIQNAATTLRGTLRNDELTNGRIKELFEIVKPFIYGNTPIESALQSASQIFRHAQSNVEKVMIVVSDGEWNDALSFAGMFENVTVVCCFVSRSSKITPRHLFDTAESYWDIGAKNLFKLSSVVPSQLLPRAMILHNGWSFDIEKNRTKLFAHVNNPELMREICRIGKNIACNQDCLSDLLVTISLDIYINQSNSELTARQQVLGTCYANASATAIHLSLKRILGRDGGYPEFEILRDELIREYGSEGANTFNVLKTVCSRYRLRCSEINVNGVYRAIVAKRIVVAKFHLTDREWDVFGAFYRSQPEGILSKLHLDIRQRSSGERQSGHAVVVTSYTKNCLILMNSWGDRWADKGFFRVERADVLGLEFMDVYWTNEDLSRSEKRYFKEHGSEIASQLVAKLRGLQQQTYTCPLCNITSQVSTFTGTLSRAECPQCQEVFACSEAGNILAMNIYLTSIATPLPDDRTDLLSDEHHGVVIYERLQQ
ncbi:hypothetical protein DPMN_145117 [Dreissena polymorpha]|uniref:Peptidase C1A papain C-terminal domain-containing protein n=1 Tax=Dreissena polymorpha TaxID=45954 RepID=A0A9D4J0Q2_DREPO|nr:hypothetical protein DPMN_145117 [Dreissena polymorpha]